MARKDQKRDRKRKRREEAKSRRRHQDRSRRRDPRFEELGREMRKRGLTAKPAARMGTGRGR